MALSGSLVDWRDEFVTEATAVDADHTRISVTRKVAKKELGSSRWVARSSNGKIEQWILTQIVDESGKLAARTPSASKTGTVSVFVANDNPADVLILKEDNTFQLTQRGKQIPGRYELSGEIMTLIAGRARSTARLVGDILYDDDGSGKVWTRKQPPNRSSPETASTITPPPTAPTTNLELIGNLDILKLVEAKLPDGVIVSKIKSSTCRFDLSTDALIKLKAANVSDVVIQAMSDAPRK